MTRGTAERPLGGAGGRWQRTGRGGGKEKMDSQALGKLSRPTEWLSGLRDSNLSVIRRARTAAGSVGLGGGELLLGPQPLQRWHVWWGRLCSEGCSAGLALPTGCGSTSVPRS